MRQFKLSSNYVFAKCFKFINKCCFPLIELFYSLNVSYNRKSRTLKTLRRYGKIKKKIFDELLKERLVIQGEINFDDIGLN